MGKSRHGVREVQQQEGRQNVVAKRDAASNDAHGADGGEHVHVYAPWTVRKSTGRVGAVHSSQSNRSHAQGRENFKSRRANKVSAHESPHAVITSVRCSLFKYASCYQIIITFLQLFVVINRSKRAASSLTFTVTVRTSPLNCTSPGLAPRGLLTCRHRTSDTGARPT